jgi:O-antigen ligase
MAFQWPAYFVVAVGGLLSLARLRKGFRFTPSGLCLVSALLFFVYLAVRAWFSPVEYLARQDLLPLAACFIGYTTFALHVEHPKFRRWFVAVLVLLILLNFGIGIYQSQYDRTWSPYTWIGYARAAGEMNAGGFFHSENHLAGFLEASLFFLLGFTLFARTHMVVRMLLLFCFMLGVIVLALTYSRGGMLSAGVGLVAFVLVALVLYGKFLGPQFGKYLLAFGAMFLILGGFLGYLCWASLNRHYQNNVFNTDQNFRYALWQLAAEQWKMSPVWGTGAQSYEFHSRELTKTPEMWSGSLGKSATFAHNDYAQLLADYGLVGVTLGGLLLLAHLGNGLRFLLWYRNVRYERTGDSFSNSLALAIGGVAAVCAYVAHSVTDFNLHIPPNAILMAAIFGLLANPGFDSDARRLVRLPGLKTLMTLVAAAAAAFLIGKGWRCGPAELSYEEGLRCLYGADYLGALPHFKEAERLDPNNYLNLSACGQSYAALAEEEEDIPSLQFSWRVKAAEQFERARIVNPHYFIAPMLLAEQLSAIGGNEGNQWAKKRFKEAIELAPSYRETWSRYGFHLIRAGEFDEAVEVLERALKMGWWDEEASLARTLVDKILEWKQKKPAPPAAETAPAPETPPPAPPTAPPAAPAVPPVPPPVIPPASSPGLLPEKLSPN